jgi:hypothetical protein
MACLGGGRIVGARGRTRGCRRRNWQRLKMTKTLILLGALAAVMMTSAIVVVFVQLHH